MARAAEEARKKKAADEAAKALKEALEATKASSQAKVDELKKETVASEASAKKLL